MKVVGIQQQKGVFNSPDGKSIEYNNVLLTIAKQIKEDDKTQIGVICQTFQQMKNGKVVIVPYLKVKYEVFERICDDLGYKSQSEMLNKDINFMFDEYSNVVGVFENE